MQNQKERVIMWSDICLYSFSGVIILLEKVARKLFSMEVFSVESCLLPNRFLYPRNTFGNLHRHAAVRLCSECCFCVHGLDVPEDIAGFFVWLAHCCCYGFTVFERLFHEWSVEGACPAVTAALRYSHTSNWNNSCLSLLKKHDYIIKYLTDH